ncbi:protein kinase domain-containing protein [Bacillus cereus]|uniref:protein kinase domain-containing protein n=1 Tax=Bacillus cereus TaxID=1396 RepID=UPI003D6573FA
MILQEQTLNAYLRSKLTIYTSRYKLSLTDQARFNIMYSNIDYPLCSIFATLHPTVNSMLKAFYTGFSKGYFDSYNSRSFIQILDELEELQNTLENTKYGFNIISTYKNELNEIKKYLSLFNDGSELSEINDSLVQFNKNSFEEINPIFQLKSNISTNKLGMAIPFELKFIGKGSYANVHKYKDKFYNRFFAVKTALKDLNDSELQRFHTEFLEMKKLKSPYVLDVYNFDEEQHRYIMEYADFSLSDYIKKHNNSLDISQRIEFVQQVFKAFSYIHSKNILHRDISPSNILVKLYDGLVFIKVSDFGLVKLPDSQLTNQLTEVKGYFSDPNLYEVGFANYKLHHEIYSLTRLIYFIFTGRTSIGSFMNAEFEDFIKKGINTDVQNRYKNVSEMQTDFEQIIPMLQQVGV